MTTTALPSTPPRLDAPPLPRDEFPTTRHWTYLNHAGMGPIPLPAVNAMVRRAMELACDGELAWDEHKANVERVRAMGARVLGVPVDDVAFVKNATEGVAFVATGLELTEGDRVIASDLRLPVEPLPLAGAARARRARRPRASRGEALPVEAFAEVIAAGPAPKVVATSWVQFRRGWRVDLPGLADVAHDAGALFCADVIQGLGAIPAELERWGVDFAMADGHKWLLGPQGTGLLYVRAAHRDLLRPLEPGWNAMRHREQWDELALAYDDSARRFEGGMPNITGIAGLAGRWSSCSRQGWTRSGRTSTPCASTPARDSSAWAPRCCQSAAAKAARASSASRSRATTLRSRGGAARVRPCLRSAQRGAADRTARLQHRRRDRPPPRRARRAHARFP